jgi:hypothetical protein
MRVHRWFPMDLLSESDRAPDTAREGSAQPLIDCHLRCAPWQGKAPGHDRDASKRRTRVLQAHQRHGGAQEAAPGRPDSDLLLVEGNGLDHTGQLRKRGDLGGKQAGRAVDPDIERRGACLLHLCLGCLDGQTLDGELHREDNGDAERDGARGQSAPQRTRPDGANCEQPEVAHSCSLASLATRIEGSGIASGACPAWLSATSSTTTPSRMIRTRSA